MCFPLKPFKIEKEWIAFGLKCVVVQNREGMNRCGYVRIPPTHKMYDSSYSDINVDVHGGLTFGELEPCVEEDGQGKWLGFDCAHYDDITFDPNFDLANASPEAKELFKILKAYPQQGHYWLHEEVVAETEQLAKQLSEM